MLLTGHPLDAFDPAKPLHGLVAGYLAQVHGLAHLTLRGIELSIRLDLLRRADAPSLESPFPAIDRALSRLTKEELEQQAPLLGLLESLLGGLELKSSVGPPLLVELDGTATHFLASAASIVPSMGRYAGNLLVLAYEVVKDVVGSRAADPVFQFLRHCRNAASHNGLFELRQGQPDKPAAWSGLDILAAMHGTRLFKDDDGCGLLLPGDPIRLLHDVEIMYL